MTGASRWVVLPTGRRIPRLRYYIFLVALETCDRPAAPHLDHPGSWTPGHLGSSGSRGWGFASKAGAACYYIFLIALVYIVHLRESASRSLLR
jgi:hypothetical protein